MSVFFAVATKQTNEETGGTERENRRRSSTLSDRLYTVYRSFTVPFPNCVTTLNLNWLGLWLSTEPKQRRSKCCYSFLSNCYNSRVSLYCIVSANVFVHRLIVSFYTKVVLSSNSALYALMPVLCGLIRIAFFLTHLLACLLTCLINDFLHTFIHTYANSYMHTWMHTYILHPLSDLFTYSTYSLYDLHSYLHTWPMLYTCPLT